MDEWYLQNELYPNKYSITNGTPLNPLFERSKQENTTAASLDDHWDLDATADDNEAFEIEQDQSE